jgi:MraZ protein
MASTDSIKPKFYCSVFRHGVDPKRRVQVPSKWCPAEPEGEFTLILWPFGKWNEACLIALPPEQMEALALKLKTMPLSDTKAVSLRRLLGSKSATVTVDKGGRICLPEAMAAAVGINSEAVMVGCVDHFEIWNPERHAIVNEVDAALQNEAFQLI